MADGMRVAALAQIMDDARACELKVRETPSGDDAAAAFALIERLAGELEKLILAQVRG